MAESKENPMETDSTPKENSAAPESVKASADDTAGEATKDGDKSGSESNTPKREYTEEEKLKRKAYFRELKEKRLAKYRKNNLLYGKPLKKNVQLSFHMSEEEEKLLDYYYLRMSVLKGENERLHRTLAGLVKENMRILEMGPPLTS